MFVEVGQEAGGDRVELSDVAEGERAQERSQSRGRVDTVEEVLHAAVAEDVHVIDRVSPGGHSRDQGGQFRGWVCTLVSSRGRHSQPIIGEVDQPGVLGQAHDRDQSCSGGEVLIVEGVGHGRGGVVE